MRLYFLIIFSLIAALFFSCKSNKETSKIDEILGLKNMSELATAEYVVTKIIKASDDKTWYKVGDRKILMSCQASLVAGIDLSQLNAKDIRINEDNVKITLPHAKLLYLNMKPENIKIVYQDVALFRNEFSAGERDQLASQAEKQITESIDSLGILVTAETNAAIFINSFLQKQGFKNIYIDFSPVKNNQQ